MRGRMGEKGQLLEGRWEQLNYQGRSLRFRRANEGCQLLNVVAGDSQNCE